MTSGWLVLLRLPGLLAIILLVRLYGEVFKSSQQALHAWPVVLQRFLQMQFDEKLV